MSKFQKNFFSSIHKIWWHKSVWMKICPPEVFWTPYHTHKPITRSKSPSTFKTSWKNDTFWPTFSLQPKFSHVWSTRLVLTKIFHDRKALIFPYTTLTSNCLYLLWSRKYFVLKIKYTRVPFSNNWLHILFWFFKALSVLSGTCHIINFNLIFQFEKLVLDIVMNVLFTAAIWVVIRSMAWNFWSLNVEEEISGITQK